MFTPEREVPDLELCKKLKKLGFPQCDNGFYWCKFIDSENVKLCFSFDKINFWDGGELPVKSKKDAKFKRIYSLFKRIQTRLA
jgi:hypothetical protein